MKKILALAAVCTATFLFTQCAKKHTANNKASVTVNADDPVEIKKKFTEVQIAEGKTIYTGSCDKCHKLFQPSEFSVKEWKKILPEMSHKAELNAEQAANVRAWVMINAKG